MFVVSTSHLSKPGSGSLVFSCLVFSFNENPHSSINSDILKSTNLRTSIDLKVFANHHSSFQSMSKEFCLV